jgi:hypothetical protein
MSGEVACKRIARFTCSQKQPSLKKCIACLKQRYNDAKTNQIFLHKRDLEKLRKVIEQLQKLEN